MMRRPSASLALEGLARRRDRVVHAREDAARVHEEGLAVRRELHPPRRAREEANPELVFEGADLPAERRLAHVETQGGAPDMPRLGHGDEVADLLEAHTESIARDQNGIGCARPGPTSSAA